MGKFSTFAIIQSTVFPEMAKFTIMIAISDNNINDLSNYN